MVRVASHSRTSAGDCCRRRGPRLKNHMMLLTLMALVSVVFYVMVYGTPTTTVGGATGSMSEMLNFYKNMVEEEDGGAVATPPPSVFENVSTAVDWNVSGSAVAAAGNWTPPGGNASLYLLNKPRLCEQPEPVSLLVMVVTAPDNSEARQAIRRTWGTVAQRKDVKLAFVVGDPRQAALQRRIEEEDLAYGDLVQGNFVDAYQNLTLKSVLILKWTEAHCPKARFVLKIDDDCFLHPDNLLRLLGDKAKEADDGATAIYGRVWKKVKPIRDEGNKWAVSVLDYPGTEYPEYTGGPTYLMTRKAVGLLYAAVGQVHPLRLEDIYVTGLCAQKVGVTRVNDNRFGVGDPPRVCPSRDVISYHRIAPDLQYLLWWAVNDAKMATCAAKQDAGCEKSKHQLVTDLANLVLTNLH